MRCKYEYRAFIDKRYFNDEVLIDYLIKNNISYKIKEIKVCGDQLIKFDLYSTTKDIDKHQVELKKLMHVHDSEPSISWEYTEKEIESAKLLWIWPRSQSVDMDERFLDDTFEFSCEFTAIDGTPAFKHMKQVGFIHIEREPNIKTKTAFWFESIGNAKIFTDIRVAELVKNAQLKDVELKNVYIKKDVLSKNIFQLTTSNIITENCIIFDPNEKVCKCRMCGKKQYVIHGDYQLRLDFSKIKVGSDLYITEEIFEEGFAHSLYIISQRFYQLLKQYNLHRGLIVQPVVESNS